MEFNAEIIDLGSLTLDFKCGRTFNQGVLTGSFTV
jgi:hypothetical protein